MNCEIHLNLFYGIVVSDHTVIYAILDLGDLNVVYEPF